MAKENRYFWLRLYDDFFTSKRIKKLRKLAGGDTYLIIYLKMQLIAMKHDGILQWSGLDDNFADELALELDEEPANVEVTINYLLSCGLAETSDDVTFFFPYAVKNVGSEGSSAKRMRESRARAKLGESSQCANDVRTLCEHRYGEKEIEKEIDIEDISSSLRSEDMGGSAPSEPKAPESGKRTAVKFVPPTLEEVEAYAASRQSWATLPVMTVVTLSSALGGSCSSKSSAWGLRVRPYRLTRAMACAVVVLSG
jgi:predicted phage replisome organizer